MKPAKIILIVTLIIVVVGAITTAAFILGKSLSPAPVTQQSGSSETSQSGTKVTQSGQCTTNDLKLSTAANGNSGAGTLSFDLVFTNKSSESCTMSGYPGVSLIKDNGDQVGAPADRNTNDLPKDLTLGAGQTAKAAVYYGDKGNYDAGVCLEGATKLRVYPPGDTGYLDVIAPSDIARCPKFEIGAAQQ